MRRAKKHNAVKGYAQYLDIYLPSLKKLMDIESLDTSTYAIFIAKEELAKEKPRQRIKRR